MPIAIGQTEQRYITQISTPYAGYAVMIPLPGQPGKHARKNFFGVRLTLVAYLAAAIAWRDKRYRELHGCDIPERIFHQRQGNSSTEIVGVNKLVKKLKKTLQNGTVIRYDVPCIIAQIHTIPGTGHKRASGSKSRLFSIAKYGEAKAIELATEWRKQMERQLAEGGSP